MDMDLFIVQMEMQSSKRIAFVFHFHVPKSRQMLLFNARQGTMSNGDGMEHHKWRMKTNK